MRVLFLCPHSAAKSVLATAMLRDLAIRNGLDLAVANAGTEPDHELNPIAVEALKVRGLTYDDRPRLVTRLDIMSADIVVTFGCGLDEMPAPPARWVDWSDAPNASDDVDALCALIEQRLPDLVA